MTIEQSYIRNCLMSVINPYHIEDNQHWHLFKYLAHWSKLAEMTDNLALYSDERCFIIDLSDSDKPHIATENSEYENEDKVRLLKTHKLLRNIENQISDYENLEKLPSPGFYEGIEATNAMNLIQRIHDFCDKYLTRDSTRYPMMTKVQTIWGLSNIRRVIAHEVSQQTILNTNAALKEVVDSEYKTLIQWNAVNHSEGGTCLQNNLQTVGDLRIGNLVILKSYINGKPKKTWQLAIVRWLKGESIKGTTVGLEYIHGDLQFINYLTTSKDGSIIEHPVLMVKPFDRSHPLLITAKNLMGGHKIIKVKIDDAGKEIRISQLIETNSKISIFSLIV